MALPPSSARPKFTSDQSSLRGAFCSSPHVASRNPAELHLLVSLSLFLFSTSIVVSFVVCRSSIYRHYRENSTSRIMNNIATRCYARPKTNVRAPRESLPRTGFFPFLSFLFPSFPLLFFSFSSFIPSSLPSYLPCFLLSTM